MHPEAHEFVAQMVREHGPWGRVIEAGSADVNGSVRHLFGDADYLGIDRRAGNGVDVVADFLTWEGEPADCLVCCEVLEHLGDLYGFADAAARAVVPDGSLILTCATFPREPHGVNGGEVGNEFYGNVHPAHLRSLLTSFGFTIRSQVVHEGRGDLYIYATRNPAGV